MGTPGGAGGLIGVHVVLVRVIGGHALKFHPVKPSVATLPLPARRIEAQSTPVFADP
jgi:hypothetical protein